jgi:hypothetical protein
MRDYLNGARREIARSKSLRIKLQPFGRYGGQNAGQMEGVYAVCYSEFCE